jgi:hypothetical protein
MIFAWQLSLYAEGKNSKIVAVLNQQSTTP